MTYRTIKRRTGPNASATCAVPHCGHNREGASLFCNHHRTRNRAYGHPLGRRILASDYDSERKRIEQLFHNEPTHVGLEKALAWVAAWIRHAEAADPTTPAAA